MSILRRIISVNVSKLMNYPKAGRAISIFPSLQLKESRYKPYC